MLNWLVHNGDVAHFGLPLGKFQNDKNKEHKTKKVKQRTTNIEPTPKKEGWVRVHSKNHLEIELTLVST